MIKCFTFCFFHQYVNIQVADDNAIKTFIGKGNIIDARIDYADIVHIILVGGYDLKHYSSINIKEIYGDY